MSTVVYITRVSVPVIDLPLAKDYMLKNWNMELDTSLTIYELEEEVLQKFLFTLRYIGHNRSILVKHKITTGRTGRKRYYKREEPDWDAVDSVWNRLDKDNYPFESKIEQWTTNTWTRLENKIRKLYKYEKEKYERLAETFASVWEL
jgi:hypothetical protein